MLCDERFSGGSHTRQNKEDQPVHDQNGPEDGHVEDLEEGAEEGDGDCARGPVPEFELGEAADEGLELLVLLGRESADGAVLHLIVEGVVGRIELGLKEGEEEVEQVDAQSVRDFQESVNSWPHRERG